MDTPKSWYYPYALELLKELQKEHETLLVHSVDEIPTGDIAFFLSCENLIKADIRSRNTYSLVVHSSSLPQGKGWSPLTWQILEGKNKITNTLFEAVDKVDAGKIYFQNEMTFAGDELLPELHQIQGKSINELILTFIEQYHSRNGREQVGVENFYPKRTLKDSELDVHKTIAEQFDLLRVVDNERYPAFFQYRGHTYIISIKKNV